MGFTPWNFLGYKLSGVFFCAMWPTEEFLISSSQPFRCSKWTPLLSRWWFQIFFIFTPTWGRFPINIFQMCWNRQLDYVIQIHEFVNVSKINQAKSLSDECSPHMKRDFFTLLMCEYRGAMHSVHPLWIAKVHPRFRQFAVLIPDGRLWNNVKQVGISYWYSSLC